MALLTAAACAAVLRFLIEELRFHVRPPSAALAVTALSVGAGVVIGLWFPRRFILRRLAQSGGDEAGPPFPSRPLAAAVPGVVAPGPGFAATLSAGLLLALAVACQAALLGAWAFEAYRGWLATCFFWPPGLTRSVLLATACPPLMLLGTVATVALVALHGWLRRVSAPHTHVARLWTAILAGGAGAALLDGSPAAPVLAVLGPPGLILVAVIVAVVRPASTSLPVPPPAGPRALPRDAAPVLVMSGAAANLVGLAFALASGHVTHAAEPATASVLLALSAIGGIAAARMLVRWYPKLPLAGPALLAASVFLVTPPLWILGSGQATARLTAVAVAAAACIVFAGRQVGRACRSLQYALAWVGGVVTAGFCTGVVIAEWAAGYFGAARVLLVMALVTAGGALALLARENRLPVAARSVLAAAFVLWLLTLPARTPTDMDRGRLHVASAGAVFAADGALSLLREAVLRHAGTGAGASADTLWLAGPDDLWEIDVPAFRTDLLFVRFPPAARQPFPPGQANAHRLLRRMRTALRPGGRLILLAPADDELLHAVILAATRHPSGDSVFAVSLDCGGDAAAAVAIGPDLPAWIGQLAFPAGCTVKLERLEAPPPP